jgi:uncharacterized lipoprotein YajG
VDRILTNTLGETGSWTRISTPLSNLASPLKIIANRSLLAAALLLFGGCATTGHVDLAYQPTTQTPKLAAPASRHVAIAVTDKRPTPSVGHKLNVFGMKTADIVSDTDVPGTLESAFETELKSRGFFVGAGGNVITVTLDNFQIQFIVGFFAIDTIANIGMQVTVKHPDGSVGYEKYVTAESTDWFEVVTATDAGDQLSAAMQDVVSKVFNDTAFIDSLNKS